MRDDLKDRLKTAFAGGHTPGDASPMSLDPALPGDGFVRDFRTRAERVVVPAMLEIGRVIERHGRFFSIERVAERWTCRGVLVPTSVQMNIFRRHHTANFKNSAPHFNVVCDRARRRVLFQRTILLTGTGPEDVGACTLDALTRDLVQDRIAAMLNVLARM